jgi:two-component system response regulator VanR
MHYGDLSIDRKARRVWVGNREVRLTRLEFDVLAHLFENRGGAVSRERLLREVWGYNEPSDRGRNTVKSCVRRLRRKLGDDGQNPHYIRNVWGVGYQLGE